MTDTSTKTVERLARELDEPSNTVPALAAERDKWHAGWMEAEAKVLELEAERDALKALLDSVDDLSSALEQYNVKYNALAEENDALKSELHETRMQAIVDFGKLQKACEERDALKAALAALAALAEIASQKKTEPYRRKPMTDLQDLLDAARKHVDAMTPEEREKMTEEQRASWVRAMTTGCEHGVLDFEQCPECRGENTDG